MKRTGFPRKHEPYEQHRERRIAEREAHLRELAMPSRSLCSASYSGQSGGGPIEKGEKARPGKGAPTVEERRWLDAIVEFGCVACWLDSLPSRPAAVHHLLRGGVRMGHLHTIGLCDPGHHQNGAQLGMVSRHPTKARFEAKYGTEAELLARLRAEIGATR